MTIQLTATTYNRIKENDLFIRDITVEGLSTYCFYNLFNN